MAYKVDLCTWGPAPRIEWDLGEAVELRGDLGQSATTLDRFVDSTDADWVLLWNPVLGSPDPALVSELISGRADVWHSGLVMGLGGAPEEHDYIHPIWPLALDADAETDSVSWRLTLDAALIRVEVLRSLGGLDQAFERPTGAGLELGRRMIDRGAVVIHTPRLVGNNRMLTEHLTEHDRFVFLRRVFGTKWVRYAALRRGFAHRRPLRVRAALRSSAAATSRHKRPGATGTVLERPTATCPDEPAITVVLPTLGRYELLRPVLDQLRKQTLSIHQLIVVDQNDPAARDHSLYEEYSDLNLEVVFQEERGQWLARNAAVQQATGEWLAFVDDDSEVGPDFLEQHLEGLMRYQADLSTGASLAVIGAPIPENYAFFRVADQWDSGNGMCHRRLFERFGLFDQQFDRQRRGDAEFGLRVQLGGGLVVHNPHAIRVHLKAQEGGLRTFGSLDGFRHRDRTSPLPLPSMVYYTKRYHTRRQVREDLVIGLSQAIVPYELKRRATPLQWAGFVAREVVHVPSTVKRVRASLSIADTMVSDGPRIPPLER